jgi:hypothetical protein
MAKRSIDNSKQELVDKDAEIERLKEEVRRPVDKAFANYA